MDEIVKALGWAAAMLATAFFGPDLGLSENQSSAMLILLMAGSVSTMRARPCRKGSC